MGASIVMPGVYLSEHSMSPPPYFVSCPMKTRLLRTSSAVSRSGGFSLNDITSVLFPDNIGHATSAHEKHTKAAGRHRGGATTGGVVGGAWACWPALACWRFPRRSLHRGPVRSWRYASAAWASGLRWAARRSVSVGLGIPELEASCHEDKVKNGNILISARPLKNSDQIKMATGDLRYCLAPRISAARHRRRRALLPEKPAHAARV